VKEEGFDKIFAPLQGVAGLGKFANKNMVKYKRLGG
jgi:hypothetical protein